MKSLIQIVPIILFHLMTSMWVIYLNCKFFDIVNKITDE
jgi:hypothetical protein